MRPNRNPGTLSGSKPSLCTTVPSACVAPARTPVRLALAPLRSQPKYPLETPVLPIHFPTCFCSKGPVAFPVTACYFSVAISPCSRMGAG